eukprot:292932_1
MCCCSSLLSPPDYLDDFVHSRTISICALISSSGPFTVQLHFVYIMNELPQLQQPLFYFFYWMILAFVVYIIIIIPLQVGNKLSSTNGNMIWSASFSLLCLICYSYSAYISWHPKGPGYAIESHLTPAVIHCLGAVLSAISNLIIIIKYIAMLYNINCTKASTHHVPYYKTKYKKLMSVSQATHCPVVMHSEREIDKGVMYCIKQFVWPTVDYMETDDEPPPLATVYPSRLFAAIYIACFGIVMVFIVHMKLLNTMDAKLTEFKKSVDQITPRGSSIHSVCTELYLFGRSFSQGFKVSNICGLSFGVYGLAIVCRSWNKKMINLRRNTPTFRFEKTNYPMWMTTKFMASFASWMITGSALVAYVFGLLFGAILYPTFWDHVMNGWRYWTGYLAYFFVEFVIVRYYVHQKIDLLDKYESAFKVLLIVSDFMYLPIAITYGMLRILIWIIFALLSYVRPDVNIYPRGLEGWDMGHVTFVSFIRLLLAREQMYIDRFDKKMCHIAPTYKSMEMQFKYCRIRF